MFFPSFPSQRPLSEFPRSMSRQLFFNPSTFFFLIGLLCYFGRFLSGPFPRSSSESTHPPSLHNLSAQFISLPPPQIKISLRQIVNPVQRDQPHDVKTPHDSFQPLFILYLVQARNECHIIGVATSALKKNHPTLLPDVTLNTSYLIRYLFMILKFLAFFPSFICHLRTHRM